MFRLFKRLVKGREPEQLTVKIENPETHRMVWVKRYKNRRNTYSGLSAKEALELEHKALRDLEAYYHCTCGFGSSTPHFPKVVRVDWERLELIITDCGPTVKKIESETGNKIMATDVPFLNLQLECIADNLERAQIVHLDLHKNNICIDYGVVGVIDFDLIVMDDFPMTSQLKTRLSFASVRYKSDIVKLLKRMILT